MPVPKILEKYRMHLVYIYIYIYISSVDDIEESMIKHSEKNVSRLKGPLSQVVWCH